MKSSVRLHVLMLTLIFNHHTSSSSSSSSSAAVGTSGRCIDLHQLNRMVGRLQKYWEYWDKLWVSRNKQDTRTCAEVATELRGELSNRSLSPWRYSLKREENRDPPVIPFAECLCEGCIINQREDLSYNSVPVFAPLTVLRKTLCPSDPSKYKPAATATLLLTPTHREEEIDTHVNS